MKVYTIQTVAFYKELLQNGVAYCNQESWMCHEYRLQYDWMAEQMRKRIGEPPFAGINTLYGYGYNVKAKRDQHLLCLLRKFKMEKNKLSC